MVLAKPEVSICIPTTHFTYLMGQCLRTLAFATEAMPSFEMVVVYDGQPVSDWAAELARVYGLPLKQISIEKAGPATARNVAAKAASADTLIFCDSDVMFTQDAIIEATTVQPGELIVPTILPTKEGNQIATFFSEYVFAPRHDGGRDYAVSAFWIMTRADFEAVGGFDQRFKHPAGEDMDFMIRWNDSGRKLRHAADTVVFHRNPTTVKELLNRASRYGRHGHVDLSEVNELPPTWLDIAIYPVALVVGSLRRIIEFASRLILQPLGAIEHFLTKVSNKGRLRAQRPGHEKLTMPKVIYTAPRFMVRLMAFAFALVTGRGSHVHDNRILTTMWLIAWHYGRFTKKR